MDTSDPSATYVSWNPGQKLELRIPISHFGNPRLTNQVCSINVLTLDQLQLKGDFLHSSHLARRDFSQILRQPIYEKLLNCDKNNLKDTKNRLPNKIFRYQSQKIKMVDSLTPSSRTLQPFDSCLSNLVWLLRIKNWRTETIYFLPGTVHKLRFHQKS